MSKKHNILLPLLIATTALAVSACSDDDDNPVAPSATNSRVMIVHASPDAPGVDILVDDVKALSNLTFPTNTGYVQVPTGSRNVKVNVVNTSTTVIEADLNLGANVNYSVFAIDSVSSIEPLVLVDDLSAPAAGKAHVRFIHLSPDAPPVDIAVTGGPVVFPDVQFREVMGFSPLDAGTYNLEVRLAGTSTVVLPLPGIQLQNGNIYTVFAKGFVTDNPAVVGDELGAEIIVNN
jgi:hypothetical protein